MSEFQRQTDADVFGAKAEHARMFGKYLSWVWLVGAYPET